MSARWESTALGYAGRGWRVLLIEPGTKEPLAVRQACPHGVKDATADPNQIRSWGWRFPDASIALATGAPGPTVLDVDDWSAAPPDLALLAPLAVPRVATFRGAHLYFAGEERGTIALPWGELRGRGSYVIAPPSVHPSGKTYTWTTEPNGALVPVPRFLLAEENATEAGRGEHAAPTTRVPHGHRHLYLKDFAVRLLRGGITDRATIEAHLWCEFDRVCEPLPEPQTIEEIAEWAAESDIASRESAMAELAAASPWWRRNGYG